MMNCYNMKENCLLVTISKNSNSFKSCSSFSVLYVSYTKLSDKMAYANYADPDQTAP